ncbi:MULTISPECIES: hypothetical protein [unclassified Pantoea]|uniref:hypothetical protein n=1 Tax=unclassified Pantoea TaxID=2630326 RepID=UPI00123252EC|nr:MULTISPECIES: hypothetical protein [unclassified Pantoea]KAA6103349.1 hypothetical protein F3I21_01095 [Pantoea sp. B_9]KAA6111750.1 hypothetical protein F3I18_15120 [Pantoea sp. B_10]
MFSKSATDNRYGSVDDVIARYDQGLISRQSLHQLRWRFKKEGKQDRVSVISKVLEITKSPLSRAVYQQEKLEARASKIDAEQGLKLKVAVNQFASRPDFQASVVLAYQHFFSAMGIFMEYDEIMAFILLESADRFQQLTGEYPVVI